MTTPLRVLIAEDSEDDMLLIVRELQRGGYDVRHTRVETPEAMRAALTPPPPSPAQRERGEGPGVGGEDGWDIVLCDYHMPRFSAPAALSLLQASGLDLPFIVVSGSISEEEAVDLLKAGAHDFVRKDKLARFIPAVQRELGDAATRRERRKADEKLKAYQAELEEKVRLLEAQRAAIRELSTPVIQVWEGILVLPIVGTVDSDRARQIMESLLTRIVETQSEIVILDITGVPMVDTAVANHLIMTVQAAKMLGARSIVTGLSPRIAQTIVELGVDLGGIATCANLRAGLEMALGSVKRET